MGSFIPFLIVNGLALFKRCRRKLALRWLKMSKKSWYKQDCLPRSMFVSTIESWMRLTRKDHFPLPFIDQMLERLARHEYYCFLDGYSGYNQIPIVVKDQEKTTFTCPFGTFTYWLGLCNAPATFQRCMLSPFFDMVERFLEIFMDDFSIYGDSFK